ncbi:histone-lysine N-methyltransferase 2B [Plectropomus leopardus]|uniref:histone-lysine N-methyltransferase 2B n=1 Tax=Plectropomus leopardus TaxID=160734 RepID=UPI001C4B91E4|nr:histone-lysine N-methyltransferase 2B [Plectropomus leopardus]
MSAVERREAPEPHWENRPSRNQDFKHPRRLLAQPRHPISTSTWLPDGSRSAHHAHRNPIYVSFVSKAILWDRGLCHYTAPDRPTHRPLFCQRFLSHMKTRPEDLRPPCFLSSKSRPQPPSKGKTPKTHTLTTPKTQTLEGHFHLNLDRRREGVQITARRSAVVVPCPPLPAASPSSTINPTPPNQNNLHPDSARQQSRPNTAPVSPSRPHPAPKEEDEVHEREGAPQPAVVSITESDWKLQLDPAGPEGSPPPTSTLSHGSLSDLSRPPSSLFSRSTDLASGRSSVLSAADIGSSDPEDSVCLSPLQLCPVMKTPVAFSPPAISNPLQSSTNATATPPLCKPLFGQTKPLSPRPASAVFPQLVKPLSRHQSAKTTENLHLDVSADPGLHPPLDSDRGLVTLAFPSTTWSSCPSPQSSTRRPGSGPKLTPSASDRLESHHWPVLPPISPVRGRCGTAASRCSELSCSQSHVFDELEAIAPRSASCPSLDEPSDSSGSPSPDTELSPGLAVLTVGCDSGNLGSLSRVQLLLLDRLEPDILPSPFDQDEELSLQHDWSDLRMQYDPGLTPAGVLRPLTAGSVSERCDSAGKVQENKSDQSEGSESPSSWIIDQSPSYNMFKSANSPCVSNQGSSTDEGGPTEEEANYPGWRDHVESSAGGRRPGSDRTAEKDREMEERKTKVLNLLSKLQDDTPHQPSNSKGCSNFDDYCKCVEYTVTLMSSSGGLLCVSTQRQQVPVNQRPSAM